MGFEEELSKTPEKYRKYYLRYADLKQKIFEILEANRSTTKKGPFVSRDFLDGGRPEQQFQELLHLELQKVNHYAVAKHEDIFLSLRRVCQDCEAFEEDSQVEIARQKIEALSAETVQLDRYIRLNYQGFTILTRKFDFCMSINGSAWFIAKLHKEAFCNIGFDDIMILISLTWARWRAAKDKAKLDTEGVWKPPESFLRTTLKFWIKPHNVVKLKTLILEHMPYLIFGSSMSEQENLLDPFALVDLDYVQPGPQLTLEAFSKAKDALEESQLLSSIYFDSTDVQCYVERIHRMERARLVRFRWYGDNNGEPDKDIFVERKVHHEVWSVDQSAKERAVIQQKDIWNYMKGTFDVDGLFDQMKKKREETRASQDD